MSGSLSSNPTSFLNCSTCNGKLLYKLNVLGRHTNVLYILLFAVCQLGFASFFMNYLGIKTEYYPGPPENLYAKYIALKL